MYISINPTYKCNLRCDFCYLTPEQLSDDKKIDLKQLELMLDEFPYISGIDLYGGEISTLPLDYQQELVTLVKGYTPNVSIITNLVQISPIFLDKDINLTVSFDFEARPQWKRTLSNMLLLDRDVSVITLVSRTVLEKDIPTMISFLNGLPRIISVELKPYSRNQNTTQLEVTHHEYSKFLLIWLGNRHRMNFECVNEELVSEALAGERNAFSNEHVYITPNGNYAVLDFDDNNREFFKEVKTIQEVYSWAQQESSTRPVACLTCSYNGRCLTEHYRPDHTGGCDGFIEVLERMED